MDKKVVIECILEQLQEQLKLAKGASLEAAEYATSEEAKADSKWDTQGLEASYLAAGQAAQVLEIGASIQVFAGYLETVSAKRVLAQSGSLVQVSMNGTANWFFLSTAGGGVSVCIEGELVTVVTGGSPIAHRVTGRGVGETFLLPNGAEAVVTRIC